MQKTHKIKLDIEFMEPVLYGDKRFEIRKNDRGYQKGDKVRFKIVNYTDATSELKNKIPAIENIIYEITYVLNGWGLKNGFVVFGFKECEDIQ